MGADWIDVPSAWDHIEEQVVGLAATSCSLEHAVGRVLAVDVHTDRDLPAFDRAAMDGFAVRSGDIASASEAAPVALQVMGESTPGSPGPAAADPQTCVRIMTGAAVPPGWDCVVPVEDTSGFGSSPVQVRTAAPAGRHIVQRGTEHAAGARFLGAGQRLSTADVAGLAMLGCVNPEVHEQPAVAVLSTGNELVEAHATPGPYHIRNSNTPMLQSQLQGLARTVQVLGAASDTPEALRSALEQGLQSDVLLVTGGVSAGAYDFVEPVLEELGVRIVFRKVALQPGKPVTFGVHERGCILALPGNPVSAWTTFRLFGIPLLLRMQGATQVRPLFESRIADFTWQRRNDKWILFPALLEGDHLQRAPYAGSGDLLALARAHGQVVLPTERQRVEAGDRVLFWPLG